MTKQEYLLQQYIVETFKENGTKFFNGKNEEEETKEAVKSYLKNDNFRENIIYEFTNIIYRNFGIKD